MKTPKWKNDPRLHSGPVVKKDGQLIKEMDYKETYVKNFLEDDEIKDWNSIEGCIKLWAFFVAGLKDRNTRNMTVLDVGTKDCQFPEYLLKTKNVKAAIGVEIADSYIEYATKKNRPIVKGDACNLQFEDSSWDVVFSHHLLGLVEDNKKCLEEMIRVSKKYVVILTNIPGNKKKHYSYIDSMDTIKKWLKETNCKVVYFDKSPFAVSVEKILILEKVSFSSNDEMKTNTEVINE